MNKEAETNEIPMVSTELSGVMKKTFTIKVPKVESNTFDWRKFKKKLKESQKIQEELKRLRDE